MWTPPTDKIVSLHVRFSFDGNRPAFLADIAVLQPAMGIFCQLDVILHAMGLHATGGVDRIAPDVICELPGTDYAGDRRPISMPMRSPSGSPSAVASLSNSARMSKAISATAAALSERGSGNPPTTI